jgi:hypothetical protein
VSSRSANVGLHGLFGTARNEYAKKAICGSEETISDILKESVRAQPNNALQQTPSSVRYAPASRRC